jgi:hypothetical protein
MPDETMSEVARLARSAKKAVGFGASDVNLPLEGAALARKTQQDQQQGQAMKLLQGLAKGKSPLERQALTSQMKDK